jgi:hypothetical protein
MATYWRLPVEVGELRSLVAIAKAEENDFFRRNPHVAKSYRSRLIGVALCQGAALQYLRCGYGVKDFDLHFFYAQNPDKPRLSRAVKRIHSTVGRFDSIPVDFIRTVIPPPRSGKPHSIEDQLRSFLDTRPTANATHLSQKAVIGLYPPEIFGTTLWRAKTVVDGGGYHRKGFVKLVAVHIGQGETATPDVNEKLLQKHLGEFCEIVDVGISAVQLRLQSGELAWAIPEEISRDRNAPVHDKPRNAGHRSPTASKSKKSRKSNLRGRTGHDPLDTTLWRTPREYRPGSGQTRGAGSRRDNRGHR